MAFLLMSSGTSAEMGSAVPPERGYRQRARTALGPVEAFSALIGTSKASSACPRPVNPYPSETVYGKRFVVGQLLGYTWSGTKETAA
jgi:hypothetical protein